MKAVGFTRYGTADVIETMELPRPVLAPDGVLIQVAAASINPADSNIRDGRFKLFIKKLPFVSGLDVAGIVAAVGENVTRFKPGDRVYAMLPVAEGGGCAEFAAVTESAVAHIPSNLTFPEAASIPLTALTSLQALRDKARLQPGQRVLIVGASGGVGIFAVQIAKLMGAHVTAVCSGRNAPLVRDLGADEIIDYTTTDPFTRRYDVIYDCVNTVGINQAIPALVKGGVLVSVNPVLANPVSKFYAGLRGRRLQSIFVQNIGADLDSMRPWLESGKMRTVIERCYSFDQVADAQRRSESKRVAGKLVIIVTP